jgi:hypothetical protein
MRAEDWQNQHLSSAILRIRLRYTADLQWPVRIWATVRARAFRILSRHDFFGGGDFLRSVVVGGFVPLLLLDVVPYRDPEFEVGD